MTVYRVTYSAPSTPYDKGLITEDTPLHLREIGNEARTLCDRITHGKGLFVPVSHFGSQAEDGYRWCKTCWRRWEARMNGQ